jgi:hypothetical protein
MIPDTNRIIDFHRTIESRTRDFTGREWLWGEVNDWLVAPGPQYFLLTGEPGCGKTAGAARLVQFSRGVVAPSPRFERLSPGFLTAFHFCSDQIDPVVFSRSVALQLARIPAYAQVLKDVGDRVADIQVTYNVTNAEAGTTLNGVVINNLYVSGLGGRSAFSRLVLDPLRTIYQDGYDAPVTLLVDSLDDSRRYSDGATIADLIADLQGIDPRVRVLATSKPDQRLTSALITEDGEPAVTLVDLGAGTLARADTAEYLRRRLSDPGLRPRLDRAPLTRPLDEVVEDLAAAAEGNFLIAKLFADAIEKEAQDGGYKLLTLPRERVPRNLDSFYRFFLLERIRAGVTTDEWLTRYSPVLGVLAVARTPLTTARTAAFANVSPDVAGVVMWAIEPFLEPTRVPDGLARAFYHRTFADFLLSPDESRNPYPIDARTYHKRVAAACRGLIPDAAGSDDPYALAYLPFHLREAGQVDELCELLGGPFARRQAAALGPEYTSAELAMAARAAARGGRDELFLAALEVGLRLGRETTEEWKTGRYVLSLLTDPAPLIRARGLQSAGELLPWPAFLAAERLLDLGAAADADEVLRVAAGRAWPAYRYANFSAFNMGEGASYDFVLEDGTVAFLTRVALVAPATALELSFRLYPDGARLPNVRSAWREILRAVDKWRGPGGEPATPEQCLRVAEVSCDWLRDPGYSLGWAGAIRVLFRLLARAATAADPLWVANATMLLGTRRLEGHATTHSNQDGSGRLEALADVIDGLLAVRDALPDQPDHPTADLRDSVVQSLGVMSRQCPAAVVPDRPSYYARTAAMGRLAQCLYRAGAEQWRDHATAAITACELDAATDDPPLGSVAESLVSLRSIPDPKLAARVDALSRNPRLARPLAEAERPGPDAGPVAPGPDLVDRLAEEANLYKRGRLALAAWLRSGPAVWAAIETGLAAAASDRRGARPRRSDDLPPPEFSEALAEALIEAANNYPGEGVGAAIERLEASRTEGRRDALAFNHPSLRAARWSALIRRKAWGRLRAEVESGWEAARNAGDLNARLHCCFPAVWFDPATAERRYRSVLEELTDPRDHGLAATVFVAELNGAAPIPAADAGRWMADLPPPGPRGPVASYQLRLCSLWGRIDALRNAVVVHLRSIAEGLPDAVAAVRARPAGRRQSEDPAWVWLGRVLDAVAGITGPEGDERVTAVAAVVDAVGQLWRDAPGSDRRGAAEDILTAFAGAAGGALPPGPVAGLVTELYRAAAPDPHQHDSVFGRAGRLELGVRLATRYKAAAPGWSEERVREATRDWESLLEQDPAYSPAPAGLADILAQTLESYASKAHGRGRVLLALAGRLVDWCVAAPYSPDRLAELQMRLARVPDPDLRTPLFAPVAVGWLRLREVDLASRVREVVGPLSLDAANFSMWLQAAATEAPIPADRLVALKGLTLDVIVSTPLAEAPDVFTGVLAAWFELRFAEVADRGDDYLRRMTDWVLGAAARRV